VSSAAPERGAGGGAAPADLGPERVAELDASDMLGAVAGLAGQVRAGFDDARRQLAAVRFADGGGAVPAPPARPTGVVVLGMGGSAIGADLVFAAAPGLVVPSRVIRGYDLPAWVSPETLVVAVSYSGDTEETLTATGEALGRGCAPLCITSGGRLAALAAERALPALMVPPGLQPRAALGHLAMPLLAALERVALVAQPEADVTETVALLAGAAAEYAPKVPEESNTAKAVARRLHGRVAVVYGAGLTSPAARRFKSQLNENAKAPAFFGELPELDHNEIEGWGARGSFGEHSHVVLFDDARASDRLRRRLARTASAIAGYGVSVERVETRGLSPLTRVFSLVTLGDHVSLYLAALGGVDPTPVAAIAQLKRGLAADQHPR
jgi:glucose/mannose-6-phosphate isomerase